MSSINDHIRKARMDYSLAELDEKMVQHDPIQQFKDWLAQAIDARLLEPYAMTLATVDRSGMPSTRIVLLREITHRGLIFFTNYTSRKGTEIEQNPLGSALFFWAELQRQVRLEGRLEKVSEKISDDYFNSRPRESNIGAWASEQSSVIASRKDLEKRIVEINAKFEGQPVTRPPYWGGYELVVTEVEFWQGRNSRLHDRIHYSNKIEHGWKIERLSP